MNGKKRGLGRGLNDLGLNELLSDIQAPASAGDNPTGDNPNGELRHLPVDMLRPGRHQPRRDMDGEALAELASSIRAQGIIQPIVVRSLVTGGHEIIAGERRWRAAQLAELHEVPVVIRDISDQAATAMALIENIQRENLNAIEEAAALQRLIDEFGMTHEKAAEAVGKSRAMVSNLLRLLTLVEDVRTMVERGDLEMGHARALLALPGDQQSHAAKTVVAKDLSVRETERLVQRIQNPPTTSDRKSPDPDVLRLQANLSDKLGAGVVIKHTPKGKGKLIISYNNLDELDGILEHIQ